MAERLIGEAVLCGFIVAAGIAIAAAAEPARASELTIEASAGADVTSRYWSVHSTLTWAPLAPLRQDGLRFRLSSAGGTYRYEALRAVQGLPEMVRFGGAKYSGEVLAGYQATLGSLTLKGFAGVEIEAHQLSPGDPLNDAAGTATGYRLVLESWLNLGERLWLSLDTSHGSARQTIATRLRAGAVLLPHVAGLSVGLEAAATGHGEADQLRTGLFARYAWQRGELSVSGGIAAHDYDVRGTAGAYATASLLGRF